MTLKNSFLILLFLVSQFVFCQSEKRIHGKIVVKDASPQGVHVINLVNEKETISDDKGEFNIDAKTDDLLVFSSNHLDYMRKIIEDDDYKSGSITIEMTAKATQLDEVKIIKYPEMDGYQLGILSHPAKKFTPAERHLFTAQSSPVDLILNAFSGRTKMLKRELAEEREASLLATLSNLYSDDYYTKELKIAPDLIKRFQFYAIQDKNLVAALYSKNKALVSFRLLQLSMDFNLLQQTDK